MNDLTLEMLAKRVEALEKLLNVTPPPLSPASAKDWRSAVGMFTGNEFMKQIDAEGQAIRQQDREDARKEFGG
ncbi:MAG: hypothetical protein K8T89_01615 [Planctomycetes bacterium]|nr:hypothetical protein [Planctomycetota bacterium]